VTGPWDPNAQDPWYEHTTPEQLAALRAFLERSWPFFDRLNDALDKPRIAFVPQFDASGVPSFDYVRPIQRVLPLLSARAVAAPAQRERISAMVAAARLFRRLETRSLHELFIAMSAQAVAIREARAAAEDGTIPAADLLRALDRELDVSLVPRLAAAARGEPALVASAWRAWRSGPSASSASRRPLKRLVRSLERMFTPTADPLQFEDLSSDDLARWMRVWSEVAEIDASSPETFRAAMEAVLQRNPSNPGGHVGELKRVADHVLRHDSASRLARVALAAKAHREATGAWPATLDALAPALGGAVPVDARNGKPFVYSTDGPKVRLAAPGDGTANDEQLRDQLVLWEFPK
jgi:hypothetical protein